MVDRTFFGKPLRDISLLYNNERLSLKEFIEEVKDGLDGFEENMKHLMEDDPAYFANTPHYMERWVETFLAWFEVEFEEEK